MKHLRTHHQLARGGKRVRNADTDYLEIPNLDMSPISMKITSFNMREILYRAIRSAYHIEVARLISTLS